jgi:hypothetical protein
MNKTVAKFEFCPSLANQRNLLITLLMKRSRNLLTNWHINFNPSKFS